MTLNEFRAWFDGFSEAIGGAPTPEQWAKIKAKVHGLDPLGGLGKLNAPFGPAGTPTPDHYRAGTSAGSPNGHLPITVSGIAAPARN